MLVRVVEGLLAVGLGVSLWLIDPFVFSAAVCAVGLRAVDLWERKR